MRRNMAKKPNNELSPDATARRRTEKPRGATDKAEPGKLKARIEVEEDGLAEER
jgi:hypothetical protein